MKALDKNTHPDQTHRLMEAWWGFGQIMRGHVIPTVVGRHGMDFKHFMALVAIKEGAQFPKQICERLVTTPSDISRVLEDLESKNFIARNLDREDSRRIKLSMTKQGVSILQEARAMIEDLLTKSLENISPKQLDVLSNTLSQLTSNIRQNLEQQVKPEKSKAAITKRRTA